MTQIPLDELLPHRPPMVLIDAVESFDAEAKRLVARVTIGENQLFFDGQGVPNWAAIEFMAQAAAALAGCFDKERDPAQQPRPGLLLGTRRLDLRAESFAAGHTYRVTVASKFWDDETAAFACTVVDDAGAVVAEAALNAYRPQNFGKFIKEQSET